VYRNNTKWELKDCGVGSGVAHQAIECETEFCNIYKFNEAGTMMGMGEGVFMGSGWCCEGHTADAYYQGINGDCLLPTPISEDTATDSGSTDTAATCGCARDSKNGAAFAVLLLIVARRRGVELRG
jgi:hypothetical protein